MFKKTLKAALLLSLAAYIFACLYLYFSQDGILFPSPKSSANLTYSFAVPFEEVWMDSDGARLHGLYFRAKQPRGLIIFFHGNSEKNQQFGASAQEFTDQGFDYFVPDYRGYGKSSGEITSEAQFLGDIEKIYAWAKQKFPENKIAVAGRSMGAVAAAYLGAHFNPWKVVMIAPFFNIKAMADIRYPLLPKFLVRYQFRNDHWITQIKSPVYLIHGTEDKTIPAQHSEWLASLAPSSHKRFLIPGAGHSNLQDFPLYHRVLYLLMNQES